MSVAESRPLVISAEERARLEDLLRRRIADVLEKRLRPLLPAGNTYQLTFVARTETPRSNVVVTSEDDLARVVAVLRGEGLD